MVGWLCFTPDRLLGHLETAPIYYIQLQSFIFVTAVQDLFTISILIVITFQVQNDFTPLCHTTSLSRSWCGGTV